MTTKSQQLLAAFSFGVLTHYATMLFAQESSTPLRNLESIAFRGERPNPSNSHGDGRGGEFNTMCWDHKIRDDQGKPVVHARLDNYWMQIEFGDKKRRLFFAYYSLREGEIIPFVGHLYRVGNCKHLYAPITWIPSKELPDGLAPIKPDSFAVPLKRFGIGGANIAGQGITVTEIVTPKDPKKHKIKAVLSIGKAKLKAEVQSGDFVLLTKEAFEVRGIVPADPKLRTVGWVEFAPSFVPESDLIQDKKALVRPMPE